MAKRGRPPRSKLSPTDTATLLRIVAGRSWHWTVEFTRKGAGQPRKGTRTADDVRVAVYAALLAGAPVTDTLGDKWRMAVKVRAHPGKTMRQHIKEAMTEVRRNEMNATEDSVAADEGIDPRSTRRRRQELRKRIRD